MDASIFNGANATFIAELYERYVHNPASVDPSWVGLFTELVEDPTSLARELKGPGWGRDVRQVIGAPDLDAPPPKPKPATDATSKAAPAVSETEIKARVLDSIRALMLIRAYRVRGHLAATLDPLGLTEPAHHSELEYQSYGFADGDLDREIFIDNVLGFERATLRQIIEVLKSNFQTR